MTRIVKGSCILLLAGALVACESQPTKQEIGTVSGAVVGGLLGAQVGQGTGRTIATIVGALGGAFLGSHIGQSMDQNDRKNTAQALETAPTGTPTSWRNPDTGKTYTVTPTRTYASASEPCRDFTTKAVIDGRDEVVHGTACRQPDGTWKTQ
jgi:surface antigen